MGAFRNNASIGRPYLDVSKTGAEHGGNSAYAQVAAISAQKDAAYEERNKVVAALARLFPSGLAKTDIPGWEPEWHGCVYIDLPTGQVSWHFHDSQAYLFEGLPPYRKPWDGHDTEEKYRRVAALRLIEEAMRGDPTTEFNEQYWAGLLGGGVG